MADYSAANDLRREGEAADAKERMIARLKKLIPFLGIILMILIFETGSHGKLLTRGNVNSIINQTVYVAVMAFGAVFVYSHGGMDLSYGGVLGFSVLIGILVANTGVPVAVVILANIVSALAWFLLNGFVSVYLKVSSFIVSLCVMYMCRGILNTVCAKQKFSVPVYMYSFDSVPIKLSVLVVSFIVCYLLFEKSPVGKANKAIGGNPVAARLSGIHTERTRMLAYVISGITVGVSAFILMARAGSVSTSTGQGMEMNVVTALVLGGVPLSGGSRVKMTGSLVGSFSVIILRNGLIILGVNERVVEGIQGIVLLLLVLLTYVKNKDGIEN
ncbi:MAG: ABC transporter permease [Clostridiales bacterium]|nr:ABC transporter permease [Clostridiales bacterium]